MFSVYQTIATSYANRSLSIHDRINDLHRRARGLARAVEESAADSGCTDQRPDASHPRAQHAWDMCAEALAWNAISDDPELVAEADRHETNGMPYRINYWGTNGPEVIPVLPDTCCAQVKLTPGRHSTRCGFFPATHEVTHVQCAVCGLPVTPDSSYASGYRHNQPALHGAAPVTVPELHTNPWDNMHA